MNIPNLKPATNSTNISQESTALQIDYSDKQLEKELKKVRKQLSELQDKMYAHNKYSVLVCIQGMDTAGKDSLIREVFKDINARGVVVHSFKTPTSAELEHDFLWRHYIALPEKGKIAVFNRTHYENVLVTRVHPEYILGENLPDINKVEDITPQFWENRMQSIVNFENHISNNGTIVFKFFLNLSKEEQRQRLLRRLEKPKHNWKFSPGDLKERQLWDKYQNCYQELITKTSQSQAPWYIVPSDNKPLARLLLAQTLLQTLEQYTNIAYPTLDTKIKKNIDGYKTQLNSEK